MMAASRGQARHAYYPIVEGYEAWSIGTVGGTTCVVPLPASTHGSLLVVIFAYDEGEALTAPGGWTVMKYGSSYLSMGLALIYKLSAGETQVTITTRKYNCQAVSLSIKGANSVGWAGANGHSVSGVSNPPAYTPSHSNKQYLYLPCGMAKSTISSDPMSPPSGFTPLILAESNNGLLVSWKTSTDSSIDPGSFTHRSRFWMAATIAVYNNP